MAELEAKLKSPRILRQYELLAEAVRIADETGRDSVMMGPLHAFGKEHWDVDWRSVDQDFTELMSLDYLFFERSVAGIGDFHLKQAGRDAAEEFKLLRSNKRKRATAILDLLLEWLHDEYLEGNESPTISNFLKSPKGGFYGIPFTDGELNRASYRLRDEGYVTGMGAMGGSVVRPSLTAKGIRAVEHGNSVSAPATHGAANVYMYNFDIRNSHGINLAAGSPGANQSNTLTATQTDDAKKVAEAFRAMMPLFGLSTAKEQQGIEVRDAIEGELVRSEPDGSKIKALVLKAIEVAALGTTGGAVEAFIGLAERFVASI